MKGPIAFRPNGLTFLGLGSNLGDRFQVLCHAIQACDAMPCVHVVGWSHCYETQPWGPLASLQSSYLNMVVVLQDTLSPQDLLAATQGVERAMGRYNSPICPRWSARIIDIDVLWQRDAPSYGPNWAMPHPRLHQRRFVLQPLSDVAPLMRPPGMTQTVTQLLHALTTPAHEVRLFCKASKIAQRLHTTSAQLVL